MRVSLKRQAQARALLEFSRVIEHMSVTKKADILDLMRHEACRYDPDAKPPPSDQERIDSMVDRLEVNMRQSMLDTPAGRLATRPLGDYGKSRSKPSQTPIE